MKISVSYLKSIYSKEKTIALLEETSCDFIHVDLMDGVFAGVKNYDIDSVCNLFSNSTKPLDIHLMAQNPRDEIKKLVLLKPKFITIHVETSNVKENLEFIKSHGISCGLAIHPDTPLDALMPYLSLVDLVLVMSVVPGRGGQEFLPKSVTRLKELSLLKKHFSNFFISVDGGINEQTVLDVSSFVDVVVSGSFVCMSEDFEKQIEKLR